MKVFISHTYKDHDFVLQLVEKLKKDGIDVWFDEWELTVGDSIVQKINEGLEKSSFLIVVLSEHSVRSKWVQRELNSTLARQLGRDHNVILPVLLELDFEDVPPLLRDIYGAKFDRNFIIDSQYQKLIQPIREKSKTDEISKYQDKYFEDIEHVDLILKKQVPSRHEVKSILGLIMDECYRNYFFKQVSAIHWFNVLKAEKYFDAINAPSNKLDEKEGSYSIPFWNVLPYLERVSQQTNLPGNEKYVNELLKIIKDVSNYTDSKGKHIDNIHTWRSFVKILVSIPKEKVPIEVIELTPTWLDSKFDASHVGSEIGLKLLPKFLTENSSKEDIHKAEKIVEYITAFKAVKLNEERAKLLGKEEELKLVIDSFWLKKIFEKHSREVGEKCTNNIVYFLSSKIRYLLKRKESIIPLEIDSKSYLLTFSSKDNKYLIKVFDKCEETLKSNLYEYVLMTKKIDSAPLKEFSVDEISRVDFINKVFDQLAMEPPFSEMDEALLKKYIYHLYRNFHEEGTHSSFYDETRTHLTEPLDVLTFVMKSVLITRARKHVEKTKEILKKIINNKFYFFPKMALFIIGNNIANYEDVFWDALDGESDFFFYESIYFGDELKHVLEGLHPLSPEHRKSLKTIISKGPQEKLGEKNEKYILEWKQERYHALIKDLDFKGLYDSLKTQTGLDVGLHAAVGEIKVRSGEGPAPFKKEEILRMPNDKLAEYLKTFKSKGFWEEGPTVGGLARLIKECSSEKPGKFIENLTPFIDTGFIYIYEILDGTREALNKQKDINWGKLFDFIKRYINRNEFWEDRFIVEKGNFLGGATHFWIIGGIKDLITEGTKDDSRAYGKELFSKVEEIIFLILNNLKVEDQKDITDYVNHTLNSPHGKMLIALIEHALLIVRVNDKKGDTSEIKWSEEIKGKYNELLDKNIIESWALLGLYLRNLFYLDKKWAEEKVELLDPKAKDDSWEAFMDGHLSIGTVYDYIYSLVKPHYKYGITHEFKEKRNNEHLVQHIALGYSFDFEKKDVKNTGSLFRKVLVDGTTQQLLDIVSFFWSHQKYIGDKKEESRKIIDRIISFWKWVYDNRYSNKTEITDDDKKIQSAFAGLTAFLPGINEEYSKWLMFAAPYANENYNSSFFIEYLDKFNDPTSISYTGKIFLKMLAHFIPDFDKEHIRSIVEKLYVHKYQKDAKDICEIYGRKGAGYEFLRDLYEKYNKTE